jgi:hypothetical protein
LFISLITLNKFLLYALGTMQVFTIICDYSNGLIIFLRILIDFILLVFFWIACVKFHMIVFAITQVNYVSSIQSVQYLCKYFYLFYVYPLVLTYDV